MAVADLVDNYFVAPRVALANGIRHKKTQDIRHKKYICPYIN